MESDGVIREYLQMISYGTKLAGALVDRAYSSMEHFVLDNGEYFESPEYPLPARFRGEPKMCYSNSFDMLVGYGMSCPKAVDAIYCEGYAYTEGLIPLPHAWLLSKDGEVLETTWDHAGDEYYGVAFDSGFVRDTLLSKGSYGVIDNVEERWPLLSGIDESVWKYDKNQPTTLRRLR